MTFTASKLRVIDTFFSGYLTMHVFNHSSLLHFLWHFLRNVYQVCDLFMSDSNAHRREQSIQISAYPCLVSKERVRKQRRNGRII